MLLGLLGSIFHSKNTYVSRYITFTHNLILYIGLVSREWMDGICWVQMTTSELGRCFQLELGFAAGLVGLGFSCFKICTLLATVYLHIIYHFINIGGCTNGWVSQQLSYLR